MAKIKVKNPVVELDGDEMTRIIWQFIKDQLILPYLDVELKYYDLGIEIRDATDDQITVDAAERDQGVRRRRQVRDDHARRGARRGVRPQADVPLAQRHDPQHPRRRHLPRADRHREHPAPGAGLDEADHHRPPRLRRPVPRRGLRRPGRRQADDDVRAQGRRRDRSRSTSSTSPAAASRWGCTTSTTRSATSRARRCATRLDRGVPVYMSTKNTILKAYDGRFKDLFQKVFDDEFKDDFEKAGLTYEHRLIDDMVAAAMKWEGGYVWACKNYDGDVQSDTVAQGFGSLGLMTQRAHDARRQHRRGRGRPRHRHPPLPPAPAGQGDVDEPDRVDLRVDARAALPRPDGRHARRHRSSPTRSSACASQTVESGKMTKDLALLVGGDQGFQTTQEFLASIDENLKKEMNA